MTPDQEHAEIAGYLRDREPRQRAIMLRILSNEPTGDPRLLPILSDLLHDETPVLVSIPYSFAEVRWVAAYALAAEYRAQNIDRPVRLAGIPRPISANDLALLARTHNVSPSLGGIEGHLQLFACLRESGNLPLTELHL